MTMQLGVTEMCQVFSPLDRISDLPDNVIDKILSCLPLKDAVRTSVLSRNWEHKWSTMPRIVVNNLGMRPDHREIISYVLAQHRGNLRKASLSCQFTPNLYQLRSWISMLAQKSIEDLNLDFLCLPPGTNLNVPNLPPGANMNRGFPNQTGFEMPSRLVSSCQCLRNLRLCGLSYMPSRVHGGFPLLTGLHLVRLSTDRDLLESLISRCPLLECLTLEDLYNVDSLHINGQKLKSCCFTGKFISVNLNAPMLKVLSLNLRGYMGSHRSFTVGNLPSLIEELSVRCQFREFLAAADQLSEAGASYNLLKTLVLDDFCFSNANQVSCLHSLMGIFPNLSTLNITGCKCYKHDLVGPAVDTWQERRQLESFTSVRSVKVRSFKGECPELSFIEYVLSSCSLLENMTVECKSRGKSKGGDNENEVMAKMLQFSRASAKAEVVYIAASTKSVAAKLEESDDEFDDDFDDED